MCVDACRCNRFYYSTSAWFVVARTLMDSPHVRQSENLGVDLARGFACVGFCWCRASSKTSSLSVSLTAPWLLCLSSPLSSSPDSLATPSRPRLLFPMERIPPVMGSCPNPVRGVTAACMLPTGDSIGSAGRMVDLLAHKAVTFSTRFW